MNIQLVGQPELSEKLESYPQLDQRIAIKFHLDRFDRKDTANYIKYRLEAAGCEKKVFSDAGLYLIFRITQGVPRRILKTRPVTRREVPPFPDYTIA